MTVGRPPIQTKLGIRPGRTDLRTRSGRRVELTASGVKAIRDAVRLRLAEARLRPLRQMATQGMPRVVVRQVNSQTTPSPPTTTASGIGELQLTFRTV